MAEYPRLGIVSHVRECFIDLNSRHLRGSEFVLKAGDTARIHLDGLSFWKLFLSMLQEISGDHIAYHLPSHGIGKTDLDLDMVQAIAENLSRILQEMSEEADWGMIEEMLKRYMAEHRGLPNPTTGA